MEIKPIKLVLFLIICFGATSCGPTMYSLQDEKMRKGDVFSVESRMVLTDGIITESSHLSKVSGKMDITKHSIKVFRIIEADSEGPSLVEVFYEKDNTILKALFRGKTTESEQKGPLYGKTVIRKRKGNRWTDSLKGEEPTPKQKRYLKKSVRFAPSAYPERKIGIGESWSVPAEALARIFGDKILTLDGALNCKFAKVEYKNGEKCALILVDMQGNAVALDKESDEIQITFNLKGAVYRSLEHLFDISTELRGDLTLTAGQGREIGMSITGDVEFYETKTIP